MSSRQIDGVWLLSFPIRSKQAATTQDDPKDTHVIHQAYLHDIRLVDLGLSLVVVINFYAISPRRQPLSVIIFADQTDSHNFLNYLHWQDFTKNSTNVYKNTVP